MLRNDTKNNTRLHSAARISLMFAKVVCAVIAILLMTSVVLAGSQDRPAAKVTISVDGQTWEWVSTQKTVGSALMEAGITLNTSDRVLPGLNVNLGPGMRVKVTRIEDKVIYKKENVPFKSIVKFNPQITGRRVVQEGKAGEKEVQYVYRYKDGVKVAERVSGSKVTKQPVSQIVAVSHPSMLASRGGSYVRHLTMYASAYTPFHCGGSASGNCAMGFRAGKGVVAVDPHVIPLGTKLYVEGYGVAMAADTGGAIKRTRIDLCFDSYGEAMNYGRRTVTVWILE